MKAKLNKLLLRSFLKTLTILILIQVTIFAAPKNSVAPWNEVEMGSLGNVNLFNGTLNMGFPLLNIGGRGETQVPLVLRLNKNWTKYFYTYVQSTTGPYGITSVLCSLLYEGGSPNAFQCVTVDGYTYNTPNPMPVRTMVFPRIDEEA